MTTNWRCRPRHVPMSLLAVLGSALAAGSTAFLAGAHAATPAVAAADYHTVALHSDGTVRAWGSDASGQLGLGRTIRSSVPLRVAAITNAASGPGTLAAGFGHVLSLQRDGTVLAWGNNFNGALGDATTADRSTPVPVVGLTGIAAVAAGGHSLALGGDGLVWTWGGGWPGDGTTVFRAYPVRVPGLIDIVAIAAGENYSVAVKRDGTVWAWGRNESGQLGDGTTTPRLAPVQVVGLTGVVMVAAGQMHTLALRSDGTVWAWGSNRTGQLGGAAAADSAAPRQVAGVLAVRVAASRESSYAVLADGSILEWGSATQGTPRIVSPSTIAGVSSASDVAASLHVAVLKSDGTVWTWGLNDAGQLGHPSGDNPSVPGRVSGLTNVGAIATGASFSVAATRDGSVYVWGDNTNGQLGVEQVLVRSIASLVPNLSNVEQIAAGGGSTPEGQTLALKSDGTVWSWGRSGPGGESSSVPVQVSDLSGVVQIAAGRALKSDGTLWVWGNNAQGQLGVSVEGFGFSTAPLQVALSSIRRVSAGPMHTAVVRSDGTVWTWGSNEFGQLGTTAPDFCAGPNVPCARAPVQVPGVTGAIDVAAGGRHTLALRADGSVLAWGDNGAGQLGDGTLTSRTTPAPVAGLPRIVQVAAGGNGYIGGGPGAGVVDGHSVARAADGTLWAWGSNVSGELGDGSGYGSRLVPPALQPAYRRTAPARIPGIEGVVHVSAGNVRTAAVRSDGTVWTWGDNEYGQIGDGTFSPRASPVLASNETFDAPLDLIPATANTIPEGRLPPFFVNTAKSGGLNATNLSVDLRQAAAGALAASGRFAATYNLYVAAYVPGLASSAPWWQLDETRNWSALTSPMAEYLRGAVLDTREAIVRADILRSVDLSRLGGTVFYVGYGTDNAEMLRAGRYRDIYTVPRE